MSPKRHTEAVQHSSKDPRWCTPTDLFLKLDEEFCFVLDVAADQPSALCSHYFGPDQTDANLRNGLTVDWMAYCLAHYPNGHFIPRRAAFMNMPYSKELAAAFRTGKIKNAAGEWIPHPIDLALATAYTVEGWVEKAYYESLKGLTVVGVIPYAPQTAWWRRWVEGHEQGAIVDGQYPTVWAGHAAKETRKIPHRVTFLRPDGSVEGNAGGNTAIVVWTPPDGRVGPWVPFAPYWSYR